MKFRQFSIAFAALLLLFVGCNGGTEPTAGDIEGPDSVYENSSAHYSISVPDNVDCTWSWTVIPPTSGKLTPTDESETTFKPNSVNSDTVVTLQVSVQSGSGAPEVKTRDITIKNGPASDYLAGVMDQFHSTFDVYTDSDAAGNHFDARGEMGTDPEDMPQQAMYEKCQTDPHSGIDCIQCSYKYYDSPGGYWAGWYFLNGTLKDNETVPTCNWGKSPNAGLNLTGATALSFYAKGTDGTERVEFFACGVGWDPDTGKPYDPVNFPYYESSKKASTGYVKLKTSWTRYTIPLSGLDLGYVLGGFGWATNQAKDITFYLDDIQYDLPRLDEPRFLVSYRAIASDIDFDKVLRNTAYTYDNAAALIAFLACGDDDRARLIADALVYAQEHDRWFDDGRVRNAYMGGDLSLGPGWTPHGKVGTVRMPGWYDISHKEWFEDKFCVSSHTGNMAWAMLALLDYYRKNGGEKYLDAAKRMGDWILNPEFVRAPNDAYGGYCGGLEGWEPAPKPGETEPGPPQVQLTYRSTEHNIDLYAAFQGLFEITGETKWQDAANNAKKFVESMWDQVEGKLYTGTKPDDSINTDVYPLDVNSWAILSLLDEGGSNWGAGLQFVEQPQHCKLGQGYDFSYIPGSSPDGVWYEGTAQMAEAYHYIGQQEKTDQLIAFLLASQDLASDGTFAADRDGVTTGFTLVTGDEPWLLYHRLHVGASAWSIFAQAGVNPFWLGK